MSKTCNLRIPGPSPPQCGPRVPGLPPGAAGVSVLLRTRWGSSAPLPSGGAELFPPTGREGSPLLPSSNERDDHFKSFATFVSFEETVKWARELTPASQWGRPPQSSLASPSCHCNRPPFSLRCPPVSSRRGRPTWRTHGKYWRSCHSSHAGPGATAGGRTGRRAGRRPGPGFPSRRGLAVSDHSRLRAAGAQQVKEATDGPVMATH